MSQNLFTRKEKNRKINKLKIVFKTNKKKKVNKKNKCGKRDKGGRNVHETI